ncbi:hypothetical protein T12_16160 [Trichinella patagoniensis]|uniref:Uncharacterized protein n=1 Tax=Trichinella patagoniensis TaxID=990121 RepID=A0A0V0Z9E3_9BILA|nr:hypothetical protein T12_16160 [Trichinella patagoniensis]
MLSSNSSVRRRFNQALFAASFLDSVFAAAVISHDCYGYSLIGCRGIRIGGPKCTNRLGVLYACDAQVRRHQARLTAAGEELTVAFGDQATQRIHVPLFDKRQSEERAQSTGVNRELIRIQEQATMRELMANETARISTNFVVYIFSALFMALYVELWISAPP